jgi:hypothetical protein
MLCYKVLPRKWSSWKHLPRNPCTGQQKAFRTIHAQVMCHFSTLQESKESVVAAQEKILAKPWNPHTQLIFHVPPPISPLSCLALTNSSEVRAAAATNFCCCYKLLLLLPHGASPSLPPPCCTLRVGVLNLCATWQIYSTFAQRPQPLVIIRQHTQTKAAYADVCCVC